VPKPPTNVTLSDSESSDEDLGQANNNMDCDPTFPRACSSNEPHLLTQGNLNDIVRDLKQSKKFETVKESSRTFRLHVKGLESSAPGHFGVFLP